MELQDSVRHAAELLQQADGLLIAAGAGIGIDSGLPDFRGTQGFWRAYPALGRQGLDFSSVASPAAFRRDAPLAWGFYGHRLALYRRTKPHAGFALLRAWATRMPHGAFVYTSNVDGQFQRAGFDEERVYECHGSIHWLQCLQPCSEAVWPADALQPAVDEEACRWHGPVPACPLCGGVVRPNILMFGDGDWLGGRYDAQEARLQAWLEASHRPLVLEIGAGTQIPSVRHFTRSVLHKPGARLIRINPRESSVERPVDIGIASAALEALQNLEKAWQQTGTAGVGRVAS